MQRTNMLTLVGLCLATPAMAADEGVVETSRFDDALVTDRPDAPARAPSRSRTGTATNAEPGAGRLIRGWRGTAASGR